jgi:hypothetical protein
MVIVRIAIEARPDLRPGPVLAEMAAELYAASVTEPMSGTGHRVEAEEMLGRWHTPGEAAMAVGMSDRHVRRLCEAGSINARQTASGRWLVEIADLQRYLRGEPAA